MILSLDLSSKSTGYCIGLEKNKIIKYGCIQSSSTIVEKRILHMRDELKTIIQEYNITDVIVEEVRTDYKNAHTYKILTWLQGAIILMLYEINPKIKVQYIQPSSWRSKIGIQTGRGIKRDELKIDDIAYVNNKYNILPANDDIADAICIYDSYFIANKQTEINWE